AGGFMIQVLPDASEEAISSIEENLAEMPLVSRLMEKGVTPEEVLEKIIGKENIHFIEKMPVQFKCDCSHDRFKDGLAAVGKEELEEIIREDKGAEVICHFCGEKYYYSEEELTELLEEIQK